MSGAGVRIGSLCSGMGGLEIGVQAVYGGTTAWVSDVDKGACKILAHRFPDVPNIGDMTTVDWSAVESVDLICGGTPCQDLSHAGKRAGMTEGTRSNLWVAMREAIAVIRPRYVVWENVRGAASAEADSDLVNDPRLLAGVRRRDGQPLLRALGRVVGDLSDLGYVGQLRGLRAADVGAPHGRFRFFIVATDATGDARRVEHRDSGVTPLSADLGHERGGSPRGGRDGPANGGLLPTPRGTDHHDSLTAPGARRHVEAGNGTLTETIGYHLMPTPRASDGTKGGPNQRGSSGDLMLPSAVTHLLPTPEASRNGNTAANHLRKKPGRIVVTNLDVIASEPNTRWGQYAAAVARWETLTRPAPPPTEAGPKGNPRLSPVFVEWLMGLPAGWVTDVPGITRNEALRALGNGVVPQQAAEALRVMASWEVAA